MEAVVMAAGEGRRLRPLTARWAKAVLPIDGRPVLATLLRELAAAELRRVWLVTGHLGEQVRALAGDGHAPLRLVRRSGRDRRQARAAARRRAAGCRGAERPGRARPRGRIEPGVG